MPAHEEEDLCESEYVSGDLHDEFSEKPILQTLRLSTRTKPSEKKIHKHLTSTQRIGFLNVQKDLAATYPVTRGEPSPVSVFHGLCGEASVAAQIVGACKRANQMTSEKILKGQLTLTSKFETPTTDRMV